MDLRAFTQELLSALGAHYDSIEVSDGHRTVVRVAAPDDSLIGGEGEVLRALNTIARRLAEAKGGLEAANFLIDVNGYHEQQLEAVRTNARMLAQRARLFKHDVELPPQSAYERLVVHELFAEDPEIETQSAGEGKFRHIVLKYKHPSAA
jgi:spoIIIJ-associated protein